MEREQMFQGLNKAYFSKYTSYCRAVETYRS